MDPMTAFTWQVILEVVFVETPFFLTFKKNQYRVFIVLGGRVFAIIFTVPRIHCMGCRVFAIIFTTSTYALKDQ